MANYSDKIASTDSLRVSTGTSSNTVDAIKIIPTANTLAANVLTITNAAMGQATTLTVPDSGTATARVNVSPAALVNGNLIQASGTLGLTQDSGITAASITTLGLAVNSLVFQLGNVTSASFTLTTAQVVGAYATPVQLIAAPGAGFTTVIKEVFISTNSTGNTAFAGGGVANLQYGNANHGTGQNPLSTTIASSAITAATSTLNTYTGAIGSFTGISNQGIFFSNATGSFTNGTGTTISITMTFQIVASGN